jgi:membrane protein
MSFMENIGFLWKDFNKNNGFLWATTLTYTTLFALVPLLAVALSLFKAFGGFEDLQENMLLPLLTEILDPTHKIQVIDHIQKYVDKINAGALGIIGTIVYILTFVPLFMGMESAMNTIWKKIDDRSIWRKFVTYWTITTLGPLAIVATLSMVSSFHERIPGLAILQPFKPMMLLGIILVLFLIFKLVPNTDVGNKPALIGATSSALCWIIASFGYKTYMKYATASFSIYGSLGAIPVFLLWIYINWIIFLFGVQVTKSVQYPISQYPQGRATPSQLVKVSLEILTLLYKSSINGVYYTEASLLKELRSSAQIVPSVIDTLRQFNLIILKSDLILPNKAASDVRVSEIVHIFIGNIEEEIFKGLQVDVDALSQNTLEDMIS